MKSDRDIKGDVEQELQWDPQVAAADVKVAVADGVVTLTGFVPTYGQKMQAEAAAKRVSGVLALANDIEVRLSVGEGRTDPEIARAAPPTQSEGSCRSGSSRSSRSSNPDGSRSTARWSGTGTSTILPNASFAFVAQHLGAALFVHHDRLHR